MSSPRFTVRVTKDYLVFSAGHFITYGGDRCERIHGHNYRTAVEFEGDLDQNQYVVDFIALRDLTRAITDELDHRMLLPARSRLIQVREEGPNLRVTYGDRFWSFPRDECVLLPIANTTSELLADYIGGRLRQQMTALGWNPPRILRIEVEECFGQSAVVEWRRDDLQRSHDQWTQLEMQRSLAHYVQKLRQHGPLAIVRGRLRWYRDIMRVKFNTSPRLGRLIELTGNQVRLEGMVFSTDCLLIQPTEKSSLFVGLYERDERILLRRWLPVDLPVVEFGGGLGVVSCAVNRKLLRRENHIVVEANPGMLPVLERNRDLNGCRFQIVNKALAYDTETVEFMAERNFLSSRIGSDPAKAVSIPTTSVKAISDAAGFDQLSLICDTEGAEAAMVDHELDTLRHRVRFLLVEIHPRIIGSETASRLVETLQASGFILRDRSSDNWAFTRD